MKCLICGVVYTSLKGFKIHLSKTHNLSEYNYYKKFIDNKFHKCNECCNESKFINCIDGFDNLCSKCIKRNKLHFYYKTLSNEEKIKIYKKRKLTNVLNGKTENWNNTEKASKTKLIKYGNANYSNRYKALKTISLKSREEKEQSLKKQIKTHYENFLEKFKKKIEGHNVEYLRTEQNGNIVLKCTICRK